MEILLGFRSNIMDFFTAVRIVVLYTGGAVIVVHGVCGMCHHAKLLWAMV